MKYTLLALVLFSYNSEAVDFSQNDKQSHALLGCASSSMFRGFAKDVGYSHENYVGLVGGIGTSLLYELSRKDKDIQEHKQDALAALIGSVVCISVAGGFALTVEANKVTLSNKF